LGTKGSLREYAAPEHNLQYADPHQITLRNKSAHEIQTGEKFKYVLQKEKMLEDKPGELCRIPICNLFYVFSKSSKD